MITVYAVNSHLLKKFLAHIYFSIVQEFVGIIKSTLSLFSISLLEISSNPGEFEIGRRTEESGAA